jgi:hypothetical protein
MNEFDNIKRKLEGYGLDNYNVSQGWDKLQKRRRGKKFVLVKMIGAVAAACVMIVAGYWLLREKADGTTHQNVNTSVIQIQKQAERVVMDTGVKHINVVDENGGLSALQRPSGNLIKTRKITNVTAQKLDVKGQYMEQGGQNMMKEENVSTAGASVVVIQKESPKSKPLEIISEEQLLAMISVAREAKPKQGKLKKFFISKGEQQEYTIEKYSSDPDNGSLINF